MNHESKKTILLKNKMNLPYHIYTSFFKDYELNYEIYKDFIQINKKTFYKSRKLKYYFNKSFYPSNKRQFSLATINENYVPNTFNSSSDILRLINNKKKQQLIGKWFIKPINGSCGKGIEIRNRNSGDARILNLDEGTTNKANLVFAVDTGSTLEEVMRLTSTGALQIGSSGPGSLTNNVRYESLRIGSGLVKKYYVIDTLDNGQKTRFTFTGTNRTSAIITIMASGSWTASNTANNHPAAQFISRVMTNSSGDSVDSSTVTTPFAYTYSTSNYTFTNSGSFGYTIDIANPTGDSGVTFSYEVTVQSAVSSSTHTLASTSTV